MPHWKALGVRKCVRGTPGHRPPPELAPRTGETVVSKSFFSAFSAPELGRRTRRRGHAARRRRAPPRVRSRHGTRRLCARPRRLGRRGRGRQRRSPPRRRHAPLPRWTGGAVCAGGRAARQGRAPAQRPDRTPVDTPPTAAAAHPPRPRRAASAWSAAAPEERARPARSPRGAARGRGGRRSPARSPTELGKPVTLGEAEVRQDCGAPAARRGAPTRPLRPRAGPDVFVSARPARRRRRRHSLEQPSRHPLGQDRPGAGSRQHGRLEAGPRRDHGSRSARSTRRATRGLPDGVVTPRRRAIAARPRAVMSDPGVDAVSHIGLLRGRLGGAGDLRAPADPAPGGARRQQRRDRLGRRGSAARGEPAGSGSLRVRGPALHGEPARRRRRTASSTRSSSISPRAAATLPWGDPFDPATRSRSPRVRGGARPGRRRRSQARPPARARLITPHTRRAEPPGSLVPPDHRRRRGARERDRAGGDVRPGPRARARIELR